MSTRIRHERHALLRVVPLLLAAALMAACAPRTGPIDAAPPTTFESRVDPAVVPAETTLAGAGVPQRVAASRDEKGVQSEFLEDIILVKPKDTADLKAFVARVGGTIVDDDTIPQAPKELGIVLSDARRAPTQWKVAIDPAKANVAAMADNAAKVQLVGRVAFSSDRGLRTIATLLDAKVAGFRVSASYIYRGHQVTFPTTLFATQEVTRKGPPVTVDNAFSTSAYADYGTDPTKNQSNATLAWQFIAAHGIVRRTKVAIIDGGFYLDSSGMPLGTDSDFPAGGKPIQYDIDFKDYFADGTNPGPGCGGGNPCFWHGTGSTGSAVGVGNNGRGGIGTGWQVADPILLRVNGSREETNRALRTAIAWGADVVSMSFGGDCNVSCRIDDRDDNPYDDEVGGGGKTVFVASAGNGRPPDNSPPNTPSVGFDVGADNFVHPCIEDRVICVGALINGGSGPQPYSNFGDHVAVFAPTTLPVMAYPPSTVGITPLPQSFAFGIPVSPNTFGGTSASAPFVAGVVAMMKAVAPDLNHDAVAQILRDTARPGTGVVTRRIDAYAAVRRAAGASPIVKDAFESNDQASSATIFGPQPRYTFTNLNLDSRDRDYFQFVSPGGRQMTVTMAAPTGLAPIVIDSLDPVAGSCGVPAVVAGSDQPLAGGGHSVVYRVPGGPLRLGLKAADVNAYNLDIAFSSDSYAPDAYEPNETAATAKPLFTHGFASPGRINALIDDPRVTIAATLHSDSDVDWYLVRGVVPTLPESSKLKSTSTVKIYGNDSQITLEVYQSLFANVPGPLLRRLTSGACGASSLEVPLNPDTWYLVRVSGSAGHYMLNNGVRLDLTIARNVVLKSIDDIIKPGGPIERELGFPENWLFVADRAYTAIRFAGDQVHVQLLDATGKVVGDGVADQGGERLSLANATAGGIFAIAVTPKISGDRPTVSVAWEASKAARNSDNLIVDPGADDAPTAASTFPGWHAVEGFAPVARLAYGRDIDLPPEGPGGADVRGPNLFGGGPGASPDVARPSAIRQDIAIDASWREAIDSGRVKAQLSAIVGGFRDSGALAHLDVAFVDANRRVLAVLPAPTIGARERDNATTLLPVYAEAPVPTGASSLRLTLTFDASRKGPGRAALADDLRLVLLEYAK